MIHTVLSPFTPIVGRFVDGCPRLEYADASQSQLYLYKNRHTDLWGLTLISFVRRVIALNK